MGKVAYRLALHVSSKIHPVFHLSNLKSFTGNGSEMVTTLPEEFVDEQPEGFVTLEWCYGMAN